MMKKIVTALLLALASGCTAPTPQPAQAQAPQSPQSAQLYAWYREDSIVSRDNSVSAWSSAGAEGGGANGARALSRVVGKPQLARVKTPGGEKSIVSLDGSSALWQAVEKWGTLAGDRTIVVLARLPREGEGFLFDGSTGAGLTRAQVRGKSWQVGVQSAGPSAAANAGNADEDTHEAKFGAWQTHAFLFRQGEAQAMHRVGGAQKTVPLGARSPLSGFILGANGAAQRGLRVQIAEVLVYNRALPGSELEGISKYLGNKWGALESVAGADSKAEEDRAGIAAKLADKSKPLIWLWSGRASQTEGQARSEPQHFAERVRWEMNRRRDVVIDTRTQNGALDKDFEARLARFRPSVVVLTPAPGEDASALIERVRKIGAVPILQGAVGDTALQSVAREQGALLVQPPAGAAPEASGALALMRALGIADAKSATVQRLQK